MAAVREGSGTPVTLGFRGLAAIVCCACGLWIAWAHPIMPGAAALSLLLWAGLVARWPRVWLIGVPALLPLANFSPWTGWIVVEEFDLVLLGAATGAYAGSVFHSLFEPEDSGQAADAAGFRYAETGWLLGALGLSSMVSLVIGLAHASPIEIDWFAGYHDAFNGVRVSKSLFYALLFAPLVADSAGRAGARAVHLFCSGMVAGLALASLAVVWERAAFVGLFDLKHYYRATALFWEMHVGGAALDGYLALALPLVVLAWAVARNQALKIGAGLTLVLATYASLATLSRGLFATLVGLLVIALYLRFRTRAAVFKAALLFTGGVGLFAGTLFLPQRFERAEHDLTVRFAHWRQGVALLRSPADWIFGRGLGRFPAEYAQSTLRVELPGAYRWVDETGGASAIGHVRLFGPPSRDDIAGVFGITQRVGVSPGQYGVAFSARAPVGSALAISLCERHLIYEAACADAVVQLKGGPDWEARAVTLDASGLTGGPWYAPRLAFFKIAVDDAGKMIDLRNVSVAGVDGRELIVNGGFTRGTARWLLTGRYYFLPWHVDNLILELLIERGLVGLALVLATLTAALRTLAATAGPARPCVAAALAGFCVVGLFGSLLDVPRVAFLFWILLAFALVPGACGARTDGRGRVAD